MTEAGTRLLAMRSDNLEIILPHVHPQPLAERSDPLPLLRTAFYTLDISARFLARTVVGTGSVEAGDNLLDGYWRRIFRCGNTALQTTGRHHFEKGKPYVVMSNHG